jgi:hypothetical protein
MKMTPADGAELFEPNLTSPVLFSGVRAHVINGVAHLLFYVEQPDARGRVEYVVVDRMVAPVEVARAAMSSVIDALAGRPCAEYLPEGAVAH